MSTSGRKVAAWVESAWDFRAGTNWRCRSATTSHLSPRQGIGCWRWWWLHAAEEKRAERARAEAGIIHRHLGAAMRPGQRDAVDDLVESAGNSRLV